MAPRRAGASTVQGTVLASLLLGCFCAAFGQVLLKIGATGREDFWAFLNSWIVFGFLAYGAGTVLWVYALSKANLTVVYPFTALTFLLVYAVGVFVLREPTSAKALAGAVLVLIGLYLIAAG